jgi:phage-related protein
LHLIQLGEKPDSTKPLKGFSGAGVLEIMEDYDGDTYRTVCTVQFEGVIYVLHCFQKKSKSGIKTPPADIALIKQRLKQAEEHWRIHHEKK